MGYLNYISNDNIEKIIKDILDIGIKRKREAEKKFTKNVIDPFGSIFDAAVSDIDHKTWKISETVRQCQKTLQNHVGALHQKMLGKVDRWEDLGTGSVVDLICKEKKIIAEVKNKYNTVSAGSLASEYYSLERLVMPKSSKYQGYISYFVTIIPKKPERFNHLFTPSDKDKGAKCPANEFIRTIDGASFYTLVTGQESALSDFYTALPTIIENIFERYYKQPGFKIADKEEFSKYFDLAYKK